MGAVYTRCFLKKLLSSPNCKIKLSSVLWCRLTTLSIARVKPTRRRSLAGLNKDRRNLFLCHGTDHLQPCLGDFSAGNPIPFDANCGQDEGNLHACITTHFRLKQLVNKPTRGERILDLVLTNIPHLYDKNSVQTLPPFGLSDHNVVILRPKTRPVREGSSRKQILRRDTRASRKLKHGCYFCGIDWSLVEYMQSCTAKLQQFTDVVKTGLDTMMHVKKSTIHTRDAPWVSPEFKELVKLWQKAFNDGEVNRFLYYRNAVNRKRKTLRGRYYASKVSQVKYSKPSQWWKSVKRIAGMTPASDSDTVISSLQVKGTDGLSEQNIANMINAAFVEPLESFQRLESVPTPEEGSTQLIIPESAILSALEKLNPRKVAGPDEIPNWLLMEYADILAYPVSMIINCSFAENRLPLQQVAKIVETLLGALLISLLSLTLQPPSPPYQCC